MAELSGPAPAVEKPTVEKWGIPFGATDDLLTNMLKTFYVAGADAKFVTREEVIQRGVGRTPLVNNLSFLITLGALERDKNDSKSFKLTPMGLEYSRAAYAGDGEKMKGAMRSLLESSFKELVDYIKINKEKLNFTDLFNHIKAMARIKEDEKHQPWKVNPAYQVGMFALIDMLKTAGLLDNAINPPSKSAEKASTKTTVQKQPRAVLKKKTNLTEEVTSNLQIGTQIQAQVVIDAKDPKAIANFLKMMKALKRINDGEDLEDIDAEVNSANAET